MKRRLQTTLGERIRTLRIRHFGLRGRQELAHRLHVSVRELERFEQGAVPAPEILILMCEVTGEDFQWLLTGRKSGQSMRQQLLGRIGRLLEVQPDRIRTLQAFLDLLEKTPTATRDATPALPGPGTRARVPVFDGLRLPREFPPRGQGPAGMPRLLDAPAEGTDAGASARARILELDDAAEQLTASAAQFVPVQRGRHGLLGYLECAELHLLIADMVGVRIGDGSMRPLIESGDVALIAPDMPARVGRPALVRRVGERAAQCRMWLGPSNEYMQLGRMDNRQVERVRPERLNVALEILYRVALAS